MKTCGLILLAAGCSSRIGAPKQLLPYKQRTLLHHSLNTALQSDAHSVVVVTGANAALLKQELMDSTAYSVYNAEWQDGIGSSIKCGLSALLKKNPSVDVALIMVCDQPFVSSELLNTLMLKSSEGDTIAASTYDNAIGTPVAFPEKYFTDLQQLASDEGAKKLLKLYSQDISTVHFPQGGMDIDTVSDYEHLFSK
jgi:molybdenum cofactor cytidylyltransferase